MKDSQTLPNYFVANEALCNFLLNNDFEESRLPNLLCDSPSQRHFNHRRAELYVGVDPSTNRVQLGQAKAWLNHYYISLPAAALVYLLNNKLETCESQAIFHVLAGPGRLDA